MSKLAATALVAAALLNEEQAAAFLNMKKSTLQKQRHYGIGPKYIRLHRTIRYVQEDLQAWVDRHRIDPEA